MFSSAQFLPDQPDSPPTSLLRKRISSRAGTILMFGVAGLLAGFALDLSTHPTYRSQLTLTANRDLAPERDAVTSQAFLDHASTLASIPHTAVTIRPDLRARLARLIHPSADSTPRLIPYPDLLSETSRQTQVHLTPHALRLTCNSPDPAFAAAWCNTLADALLTQSQARDQAQSPTQPGAAERLVQARVVLKQQLIALRKQARESSPSAASPALTARLDTLQQAILDTQAEERSLAQAGNRPEEYAAALHREQLLHISFDIQRRRLPAAQNDAAQGALLHREIVSSTHALRALKLQIAQAKKFPAPPIEPAALAVPPALRISQPAQIPASPHSPNILAETLIGAVTGALFGLLFVIAIPGQHEHAGLTPALLHQHGVIPDLTTYITDGPYDPFQLLAYSVLLEDWGKKIRRYAITSLQPGSGKTTIAANIGIALSGLQLRVLVIDANLQDPALHSHFELANDFGLRNILRSQADLEADPIDAITQPTTYPGLSILTAGRAAGSPETLLKSPLLTQLFSRLAREFDILLVDLPAVDSQEAILVAGQCDGTLLVLPPDGADLAESRAAIKALSARNIRVAGAAINHLPLAS